MEYGNRDLFEVESLDVIYGEKIGIIGRNGAGKTTLLEVICKSVELTKGNVGVLVPFVYVPQLEEFIEGDVSDISANEWNIRKNDKSGGEVTRKKLAKAFSAYSELMLLDEPTSNLDSNGIETLENMLVSYSGSMLLISHDRALLDKVCDKIWEIKDGVINEYKGNYTSYSQQKDLETKKECDNYEEYTAKRKQLEQAMKNRSSKAKAMKNPPKRMGNSEARLHRQDVRQRAGKVEQASKQIKRRIEQLEVVDKPKEERRIKISAQMNNNYVSKTAISIRKLNFAYEKNEVLKDISLTVKRGEKVAIIGDNGSGKSTLMNCIYNSEECVRVANGAELGYFRQDLMNLDEDKTVLDCVKQKSDMNDHEIRTVLGSMGIRKDDVFKTVKVLSGGERCKVSLAQVICGRYPILLLDEPTNYLDIHVLEALEEMLLDYDGTVLLVSHDRYFREKISDREIEILNGKIKTAKNSIGDIENSDDKLLLEMKKADLISRMTYPGKGDDIDILQLRYAEICEKLNNVN